MLLYGMSIYCFKHDNHYVLSRLHHFDVIEATRYNLPWIELLVNLFQ